MRITERSLLLRWLAMDGRICDMDSTNFSKFGGRWD